MGAFSVPGLSDAVAPNPLVTAFPAVDTFTIASFTMPGKWTLTEAPKEFGWQVQQGYGLSGAVVFPKGDPLIIAKFRGEIWNTVDFALYKEIRKQLLLKPAFQLIGGAVSILPSAAMGIDHPELKALGMTSVVVLKTLPAIQQDGGLWVVGHEFLQFRAPKLAPPKPKTIIPDIAPPTPSPKTALELEAQRLAAVKEAKLAALAAIP